MIFVKKKRNLRERLEEVDHKLALGEGRKKDLLQSKESPDQKAQESSGSLSSGASIQEHDDSINNYIKSITNLSVPYKFHKSFENTIAHHVREQLQDRIIKATNDEKDLYFLTAFLDRSALDVDVQHFRINHPYFKEELIQCWNEDNHVLTKVTQNIESAIDGFEVESPTLEKIYQDAPGRFKLNQILVCLKIIKEIYSLNKHKSISQIIPDVKKERDLRDYLLRLYGVGYKLANWSITNVTGHWFVIDMHIKNAINEFLKHTLPNVKIHADNADKIFSSWFGILDLNQHQFSRISKNQFISLFPDFSITECQYLPFIMTQYLWFHGKFFLFGKKCN
jgi:hypothetical protein